jgi:hypothetical protein
MLLLCVGSILLNERLNAEDVKWTCGVFAENKSGKVTTLAEINEQNDGGAIFHYTFERPESNQVYIQYPVQTADNYAIIMLPIFCKSGTCQIEVWLEADKWVFQKKMLVSSKPGSVSRIPIIGLDSKKLRYMKLTVANNRKTPKGTLYLKPPKFAEKIDVNSEKDGLEAMSGWYPVVWKDKDGKKRASLEAYRKTFDDKELGCILNVNYDFPDERCTQVEMRLPLKKDCEDKEFMVYLCGDGSGNPIEVWCTAENGQSHFLGKHVNDSAKPFNIGPVEAPEEVQSIKELKVIIVNKKTGKGTLAVNKITLE